MQRIAEPDRIQLEFSSLFSKVILASSSPNRKKLLEDAGVDVSVFIPEADESRIGDTPEEIVRSIARRKMEAYLSSNEYRDDIPAIAADTLVLIDEELLGKPSDKADAYAMLGNLSGRRQRVISAAGIKLPGKEAAVIVDTADVVFRTLSDAEIMAYIATGEWEGAAGGYRLQKTGYTLVDRIYGDWTTVVGLPLKSIISFAFES